MAESFPLSGISCALVQLGGCHAAPAQGWCWGFRWGRCRPPGPRKERSLTQISAPLHSQDVTPRPFTGRGRAGAAPLGSARFTRGFHI